MSKQTLEDKKVLLEKMNQEISELLSSYSRYNELTRQRYKLQEDIRLVEKLNEYNRLNFICSYMEPTYPDMGIEGSNGFAILKDEETGKTLMNSLNNNDRAYHELKWSGPGDYIVVPSYKIDRDGEVFYTATFVRNE